MIESDEPKLILEKMFDKIRTESKVKCNTKEKAFKCDCCDQRFSTRGSLDRHLKIHTEEKRFERDYCEKKFNRKDYLKTHREIHTGEKSYQC